MSGSGEPITEQEKIVVNFFDDMGTTYSEMRAAFDRYLTDDCVWSNSGLPEARGKAAVIGYLEQLAGQIGLAAVGGEVYAIASRDDVVLTQRHEVWTNTDGATIVESLPVMGTFEVRDGKIASWKDYFDPTKLSHLM